MLRISVIARCNSKGCRFNEKGEAVFIIVFVRNGSVYSELVSDKDNPEEIELPCFLHHKQKGGNHNTFTLYSSVGGENPIGALAVGAYANVCNSYLNDPYIEDMLGIQIDKNKGLFIE